MRSGGTTALDDWLHPCRVLLSAVLVRPGRRAPGGLTVDASFPGHPGNSRRPLLRQNTPAGVDDLPTRPCPGVRGPAVMPPERVLPSHIVQRRGPWLGRAGAGAGGGATWTLGVGEPALSGVSHAPQETLTSHSSSRTLAECPPVYAGAEPCSRPWRPGPGVQGSILQDARTPQPPQRPRCCL